MANPANLGGVHLHYGGHANPQRTVQAYAWALQDSSAAGSASTPPATDICCHGRRAGHRRWRRRCGLFRLRRPGDRRRAADGDAAGPGLGLRLPLGYGRAEMIVTEPAPLMRIGGVDGLCFYGLARPCAATWPSAAGRTNGSIWRRMVPAARPSSPLARNLARRVAELLPGRRPMPPDPQLGRGDREHAGRATGKLDRLDHPEESDGGDHVQRRLRPRRGQRPRGARPGGRWPLQLRRSEQAEAGSASG